MPSWSPARSWWTDLLQWGLAEKQLSAQVLSQFFYGASGTTMIAGIVLAMRLLAEERQTGTITLLNTSPIKDSEIVVGKFVSAFAVLAVMTPFTLYMPLLIFVNGKVSVGHIIVGYGGLRSWARPRSIGLSLRRSPLAGGGGDHRRADPRAAGPALGGGQGGGPPLNTFLSALAIHHENFRPFMSGILELEASSTTSR